MIKTVTVSGITTVDFDPEGAEPYFYAANKYVWIRNDSEDAMYASLSSTCTAGADGTAKISAGEAGMLVLSPDNTIYLSGSGAAEIRTGDTAECPFKTAAKGGDPDAVKYTEQSLTSEQQAQARENIGAAASTDIPTDAVKYTAQTLTDAQKTQARTNIGVVQPDWRQSNSSNTDYIKNKPPILAVYPGTSGSYTGGTGMSNMNEATKQNSIAYGYGVSAKGNYSAAFGYFLQALHDYEIAYGKFNQSNDDTAFSIGDGTSTSDRHNLMELKTDGTLLLNGNAVKTEGGDDNKLRLGQIWGMRMSGSGNASRSPKYGFSDLFESSPTIYTITFQANYSSVANDVKVYQFGDFVGFISSSTVTVQPLLGRKVDYPTTGKWIKVENCYHMFTNCTLIRNFDLSMFDTSEVENMNNMFAGCAYVSFKSLDLSMIDTSKVKDMTRMFYGCTYLKTLDISSFDMTNVIEYTDMFTNDTALTTLKTPKINPHDDIPLNQTLYSQDGTAYTKLPVTTGTSIELRQSWT